MGDYGSLVYYKIGKKKFLYVNFSPSKTKVRKFSNKNLETHTFKKEFELICYIKIN